jgi:hypothetical protein
MSEVQKVNTEEKLDALELWATFAAEALQEVIDEAQEAAGDPEDETECQTLRSLLKDLDAILMPELATIIASEPVIKSKPVIASEARQSEQLNELALPNDQWLRSPKKPEFSICLDQERQFFGWVMQSINGQWVSIRKLTHYDCQVIYHQPDLSKTHREALLKFMDSFGNNAPRPSES